MTSRYSGFFVEVDAHSSAAARARAASACQRSPAKTSLVVLVGEPGVRDRELAANVERLLGPIASSRLSASVSTRETKKLATERTLRCRHRSREPLEPADVRLQHLGVALRGRRSA